MTGSELARTTAAITDRARAMYDSNQISLIKSTVGAECANDAELALFIEVVARYELDPFAKQIWAIKIQGKLQIVVSRDGLLALANRSPDFRGCQSYEVREFDEFEVFVDPEGHCQVKHRWLTQDGKSTHGGADGMLRGPIIGAFAFVRREGHVDTQFFAYRAQYDKVQNVWRTHPTAMMIKCAEAMALRKAFSVSGVVGEHEVAREPVMLTQPGERPVDIDFGEDEELADDLRTAFGYLGYRHAKVRTVMRAATTREQRQAILDDLKSKLDEGEIVFPSDVSA